MRYDQAVHAGPLAHYSIFETGRLETAEAYQDGPTDKKDILPDTYLASFQRMVANLPAPAETNAILEDIKAG